jgi:hypothetical protein
MDQKGGDECSLSSTPSLRVEDLPKQIGAMGFHLIPC